MQRITYKTVHALLRYIYLSGKAKIRGSSIHINTAVGVIVVRSNGTFSVYYKDIGKVSGLLSRDSIELAEKYINRYGVKNKVYEKNHFRL